MGLFVDKMVTASLKLLSGMESTFVPSRKHSSTTGSVTPQTQKVPKHEKNIPRVPIDFSFLANQTIGDLSFPHDKNI